MSRKAQHNGRVKFTDWETVLAQSEVPPHRQESMAITLRWYLSWAKRARVSVDFDSARDFITQVEMEKRPPPYRLEQWKEALRWFFREGRKQESGGRRREEGGGEKSAIGIQNPETVEVGSGNWRARMIRLLRVRKYSYRSGYPKHWSESIRTREPHGNGTGCGRAGRRAWTRGATWSGGITCSTSVFSRRSAPRRGRRGSGSG